MTEQIDTSDRLDKRRRNTLLALGSLIGVAATNRFLGDNGFEVAVAYASSGTQNYQPKVFAVEQLIALKHLCQCVIPKTDTPGAGDVNTHGFIDNQLHHCFGTDAQKAISEVISKIEARAIRKHKQPFKQITKSQAESLLNDIDLCKNGFNKKDTGQFKFLKSLIVFGYYTSEVGASQELTYDPVPGGFKSGVPLSDVDTAWGSLDFF